MEYINTILHMVYIVYLKMRMIITNQKKLRELLMVDILSMKVEEILMLNYLLMNILT